MKKLFIILAILIFPIAVHAQVSRDVLLGDRVYRALDKLIALGVVDNVIYGQRPYTADEIARILIEAEGNIDNLKNPADKITVYRLLKYWKEQYRDNIEEIKSGGPGKFRMHYLDALNIYYDYRVGPDRNTPNNGLGTLNDGILPLYEYNSGIRYAEGNNFHYESVHWIRGPYFLVFARPMFQTQIPKGNSEPDNSIQLQELYLKAGTENFEFTIGRNDIEWGQGEFGGMMISSNGRPQDLIKISNPHPFKLPWILRHLGNFSGMIYLSNFGHKHDYKYTYLGGWKVTFQPSRLAEFGLAYGYVIGGDGAPNVSAGDVARTFFGFMPRVSKAGVSDQNGGVDFRVRIPPVWDAEIYGELFFQNPDLSHPGVMFSDRAGYYGGIYFPRVGPSTNTGLRFEYKHTSPYIYRSFIWPAGYSIDGEVLGDALGTGGDGVYATYYYDFGTTSLLTTRFAYERRGGDIFSPKPDGGFSLVSGRPTEERYRIELYLDHKVSNHLQLKWLFGYERASNFNFVAGDDKNSFSAGLNLCFNLGL